MITCEYCAKNRATLKHEKDGIESDVCGPCFRAHTSQAERKQIAAEILPPKAPMTQLQEDVLAIIRQFPGLSIVQLAAKISMPRQSAGRVVTELRKMEKVLPATSEKDPNFGKVFPVEPQCPVQTADVSPESGPLTSGSSVGTTAEMPVDPGNTIGGAPATGALTSESGWGVPLAAIVSATPAFPSEVSDADLYEREDGQYPVMYGPFYQPTSPEMGENHLAALGAAQELAGEVAGLKLQIAALGAILGCDGPPENTLRHLSEVLVDAGVTVPVCDRAPNCKSLHLLSRVHDLANERDSLRVQIAALEAAAGREDQDASKIVARAQAALRVARSERNALESDLTEIDWLCMSAGFVGSGDTVDKFCWLLRHLGYPYMANAIPTRRRLQMEIRGKEQALQELVTRVRVGLPPETSDRCDCGDEARKVEGESGFTKCNGCYHQEGAE